MPKEEKWYECYPEGRGTSCLRRGSRSQKDVYITNEERKIYDKVVKKGLSKEKRVNGHLSRQRPFFFIDLLGLNKEIRFRAPPLKLSFENLKNKLIGAFGLDMEPEIRFYFPSYEIKLHSDLKKELEKFGFQYGEGRIYARETTRAIPTNPPSYYLFEKGTSVQLITDLTVLITDQVISSAYVICYLGQEEKTEYHYPIEFLNSKLTDKIKIIDTSDFVKHITEGIAQAYADKKYRKAYEGFEKKIKNFSSIRHFVDSKVKDFAYVFNSRRMLPPAALYIDYFNISVGFNDLKSKLVNDRNFIRSLYDIYRGDEHEIDRISNEIKDIKQEGDPEANGNLFFQMIKDFFLARYNLVDLNVFMGLHPPDHDLRPNQNQAIIRLQEYGFKVYDVPMYRGAETGVDELMAAKIIYDVYSHADAYKHKKKFEPPEMIKIPIILTGDRDFLPVFKQLKENNTKFHVWSWKLSFSSAESYVKPKWLASIFGLGERGGESILQRYREQSRISRERARYNLND